MIQRIRVAQLKANPNNPRIIKDDKFYKLVESIRNFPEMLEARPIVVNQEMIVLGGNMRLKALIEAEVKEVPVEVVDWDAEKQAEFIIKDNVGFGEWDWDDLANNWDVEDLEKWGLDVPTIEGENDEEEVYSTNVESPIYSITDEKPDEKELYNLEAYNRLISKIEASDLPDDKKEFLKLASTRHIEFNYKKIAEFYAHEEKLVQELMEENALVIIDYGKAIELGFVKLYADLESLSEIDE
jgi:hypothetical protein